MLNEYLHVLMKISVLELKTFLRKCIDLYIKKNILETAKETLSIEQFYGLCGRGRGWKDLGEWH